MVNIGQRGTLPVLRQAPPGLYLDGGTLGEILLPNRYVPRGAAPGDRVAVFVYRDSEDRLVATTEQPHAMVGEVATLKVVSLHERAGAFLDWGLAKDLLLPFREQTGPVAVGDAVVVRVCLDEKTQRIVATMRLAPHGRAAAVVEPANYRAGQAVEFLLTGQNQLGYTALIEGVHAGLLFRDQLTAPVAVGQTLRGFVRVLRPDGKVDLTLDQAGYQRVRPLAERILQTLQENGGRMDYDDDSEPAVIRVVFGVSKKAFKQALGTLYKSRRVRFLHPGVELAAEVQWAPGERPAAPARPARGPDAGPRPPRR